MDRLIALFALLVFAGFLFILVFEVPSPDLIVVVVATTLLVAYDFLTSSGKPRD